MVIYILVKPRTAHWNHWCDSILFIITDLVTCHFITANINHTKNTLKTRPIHPKVRQTAKATSIKEVNQLHCNH